MDLPAAFLVIRLLVLDTARQSLASRLFWLILGLIGLSIVLCLSVRLEGATATKIPGEPELFGADSKPFTGHNRGTGYLTFAFGAVRVSMARDQLGAIRFLHALIAQVATLAGTLLLLVWSSGFLPEFLDPQSVAVLLAKPVPRWSLLVGKFLGVLLFVWFQVALFVGGTWLALGVATGIWHAAALFSIPLLMLLFAILYSVSAFLAVWTRSAVACIFGTLLFCGICSQVAHQRSTLADVAYWVLPKPRDCWLLITEVMQAQEHFGDPMAASQQSRALIPELSVLTSILFVVAILALAGRRFVRQDY